MIATLRLALPLLLVALMTGCAAGPAPVSQPGDTVSGPVVGPRWNLLLVGTSDRLEMPATPWFQVAADGSVTGSDGCNRLTGSVALDAQNRIEFSRLASTRRACPNMAGARQVTEMLDQAYRYLIDHDRLVFFGPDQHVLGGFRRAN
ncbi:META domain-containing protein [Halomonas getboli]|uniref:META domain-containing protein n=1 Tax=Halomonas getboli TaxID=2935862 RepID=UPI001FFFD1CA|nr:META domain-containing protein [Halomonas getboli]MCK2183974.1 META domain-containing protein [Halomonas getboli]